MKISKAIKKGLQEKDLKQKDLAKMMNKSISAVSDWVGGKTIPPGDILIKIINDLELIPIMWPEYEKKEKEKIDVYLIRKLAKESVSADLNDIKLELKEFFKDNYVAKPN